VRRRARVEQGRGQGIDARQHGGVEVRGAHLVELLRQGRQANQVRREPHRPDLACVGPRDGACLSRAGAPAMPQALGMLPTMKL
jgi:hypothetical protein